MFVGTDTEHAERRIHIIERKLSLIQSYIEIDAELEARTRMGHIGDRMDSLRSRKAEIRRELRELD